MMIESDFQIRCPNCQQLSEFTYATSIGVKKKDIGYFKNSKVFKVAESKGWKAGRTYYYVLHYPYLMPKLENIDDLPEDYSSEKWRKRLAHGTTSTCIDLGVVLCSFCNIRQKHELNWPDDAYFQIDYKGETLWAYNRSYAIKLRDYIASDDRKKRHPASTEPYIFQDRFLRKIPEHFQTAKARGDIVRKLNKILHP